MLRRHSFLALIAVFFLAAPLLAAAPFGSFGGKVGGGNAGAGVIPIHGWAIDADDRIESVDIVVDGLVAGRAQYGRTRPGVTQMFPGFPDSAAPGFAWQLDSTRYLNGLHRVWARVTSESGEVVDLNSVVLEFTNLTHNLVPFGNIDFPNPNAELLGNCDLDDTDRRLNVVWGYALDVGVETGDQGVGYVELLIDGAVYANSFLSCFHDDAFGGSTNCYGLRRLDVARIFNNLDDAVHSGFRFVLDVGRLMSESGYNPGKHVLTIRSGDIAGGVANIDQIPVTFACDDLISNRGSFGEVRRPRGGLIYQGVIEANGWALDPDRVVEVQVYVDGDLIGNAEYGFARPAITNLFPGYPDSALPGWRFFLDTTTLSDGPHLMQVLVRDLLSEQTLIGERSFVVLNNP